MCVWRQTSISRAVILLWKSRWRLTHAQTYIHIHTHTHTRKAHIGWFPLTGTDTSQLALKFVLSKGAEMPNSPALRLTKGCRNTKRWRPQLQRADECKHILTIQIEVWKGSWGCLLWLSVLIRWNERCANICTTEIWATGSFGKC